VWKPQFVQAIIAADVAVLGISGVVKHGANPMKQVFGVLFLASIALSQQPAPLSGHQQATGWSVDKNHSSVSFSVAHLVFSEVSGRFRDFDINVYGKKEDFTDATFSAVLKVDSLDTGNSRRDSHLRADDFFNAAKFPEIRFQSTSLEKSPDNTYKINGNLTIRDSTRSVTFDAVLKGMIKGSQGTTAAWKATLKINRFDYNLKWSRSTDSGGLVVGEEVTITLVVELRRLGA
jgi:polyisoprenoid-binding protein YceI